MASENRYWSYQVVGGMAWGSHTCTSFVGRMWSGGAREWEICPARWKVNNQWDLWAYLVARAVLMPQVRCGSAFLAGVGVGIPHYIWYLPRPLIGLAEATQVKWRLAGEQFVKGVDTHRKWVVLWGYVIVWCCDALSVDLRWASSCWSKFLREWKSLRNGTVLCPGPPPSQAIKCTLPTTPLQQTWSVVGCPFPHWCCLQGQLEG